MRVQAVLVDLDDTLIVTSGKYREVRTAAYDLICSLLNLDWLPEQFDSYMDAIETVMKGIHKFEKQRFPLSLAELYRRIATEVTGKWDYYHAHCVEALGWTIYDCKHKLLPYSMNAISYLNQRGYELILFTKGDPDIQVRKINHAKLGDWFDAIEVVPDKTVETFQQVLAKHGLDPSACVMIGDSIVSDINPALRVGMQALYIEQPDAWKLEVEDLLPGHIALKSIQELPAFFERHHVPDRRALSA